MYNRFLAIIACLIIVSLQPAFTMDHKEEEKKTLWQSLTSKHSKGKKEEEYDDMEDGLLAIVRSAPPRPSIINQKFLETLPVISADEFQQRYGITLIMLPVHSTEEGEQQDEPAPLKLFAFPSEEFEQQCKVASLKKSKKRTKSLSPGHIVLAPRDLKTSPGREKSPLSRPPLSSPPSPASRTRSTK